MHRRLSLAGGQPTHFQDTTHHVEVFAIQALDDLTGHLIQQHKFSVPPDFLDWIGQEATNLTRLVVRRYVDNAGTDAALNPSRAEIAILRLVYQTVTPMIKSRFEALTAAQTQRASRVALQTA